MTMLKKGDETYIFLSERNVDIRKKISSCVK